MMVDHGSRSWRALLFFLVGYFALTGIAGCAGGGSSQDEDEDVGIRDIDEVDDITEMDGDNQDVDGDDQDTDIDDQDADGAEPIPGVNDGKFHFNFGGAQSGEFRVDGTPLFNDDELGAGSYGVGMADGDDSAHFIGVDERDAPNVDIFHISVHNLEEAATLDFDVLEACQETDDPCASAVFMRQIAVDDFSNPEDWIDSAEEFYRIVSGSITVSGYNIDSNLATGHFSAKARIIDPAEPESLSGPVLAIASGAFDIYLIDER